MSRLDEIKNNLKEVINHRSSCSAPDHYLEYYIEDTGWLVARVEKLELYLNDIESEAYNHSDNSLSSKWLALKCQEALAYD